MVAARSGVSTSICGVLATARGSGQEPANRRLQALEARSQQHRLDGTTEGTRHFRASPESHHEVGPLAVQAYGPGELGPEMCLFDRLVHERVSDSEYSCLEGETFVTAADFHPLGPVVFLRHEHGDPCRTPDLAGVFVVLGSGAADQREERAPQPARHGRASRGATTQSIPGTDGGHRDPRRGTDGTNPAGWQWLPPHTKPPTLYVVAEGASVAYRTVPSERGPAATHTGACRQMCRTASS